MLKKGRPHLGNGRIGLFVIIVSLIIIVKLDCKVV